jgi:hypothetical protein
MKSMHSTGSFVNFTFETKLLMLISFSRQQLHNSKLISPGKSLNVLHLEHLTTNWKGTIHTGVLISLGLLISHMK